VAVVTHPFRRRVIAALMLIGGLGLATVVAGLLTGFAGGRRVQAARRSTPVIAGMVAV
jgi:hypothetical protein